MAELFVFATKFLLDGEVTGTSGKEGVEECRRSVRRVPLASRKIGRSNRITPRNGKRAERRGGPSNTFVKLGLMLCIQPLVRSLRSKICASSPEARPSGRSKSLTSRSAIHRPPPPNPITTCFCARPQRSTVIAQTLATRSERTHTPPASATSSPSLPWLSQLPSHVRPSTPPCSTPLR
jgi:hypothetical protein